MLTITYTIGDTTETVTVRPAVMRLWELKTGQKASDLAKGYGINDMLTMVYEHLKHRGDLVLPKFDAWADTVDEIKPEGEARPTDAAASAGE